MLTRAALVRRPAVLAVAAAAALAALVAGGSLVATAVEGEPEPVPTAATGAVSTGEEDAAAAEPTATDEASVSHGDDNVAAAVNTRDGSTVYAVRLRVVRTSADVVDAGNAAVAVASCEDCTTVAIALEGVLVTGDAEEVVPVNLALAYNQDCSGCQTLAYAYQKVMSTGGRVRITGEGQRRIAALRAELSRLRTSGLSIDEVAATVDRIAAEFATVLETETVPVGAEQPGGDQAAADQAGEEQAGAGTSAAPTPSTGADPGTEPQPAPDDTVAPTADSPTDGG